MGWESIRLLSQQGPTGHGGTTDSGEREGVQIVVNLLLPSSLNQMGRIQYIRVLVSARTQHNGTKVFIVEAFQQIWSEH